MPHQLNLLIQTLIPPNHFSQNTLILSQLQTNFCRVLKNPLKIYGSFKKAVSKSVFIYL